MKKKQVDTYSASCSLCENEHFLKNREQLGVVYLEHRLKVQILLWTAGKVT